MHPRYVLFDEAWRCNPLADGIRCKLHLSMSTAPQEDWRAEALRRMETADQQPVEQPKRQDNWLATVIAKTALLIVLSVALVYFAGWGFLAAPAFAAWFLFWPR